jgi:hypothetical protein
MAVISSVDEPELSATLRARILPARSLKQLIETVEMLSEREIGFRSLTENIDTTSSGFTFSAPLQNSNVPSVARGRQRAWPLRDQEAMTNP